MNHQKISRWHLERTAFVYVRQSSPHQVKNNTESAARQRQMRDHIHELGWPKNQIQMLGGDTAKSGSSLHGRDEYHTILKAVVAQEAGVVCARELSRLVRDNQDWNQLVRLCRYQGVLLADEHRVYDPADAQDRVMLGIHGAFNEYELAMICDRMQQSRIQKAQRGELYESFPPGYICRRAPLYERHPDARVRRAVNKIFADYKNVASVLALHRQLLSEGFRLPVVAHGADWREVEWKTPKYKQLVEMLRNPTYAGIYARGKKKTFTLLDEDGHAHKKRRRVPREEWEVFLEDHHEPYISKETWERNMEKIAANAQMGQATSKGSPQNGRGLMVGLLRCRRCGHKLYANYCSGIVSYVCRGGGTQRDAGGRPCFSFRGTRVEQQLVDRLMEVISPAGIDAAKEAAQQLAALDAQQRQLIVDRLDASREIEARAAREYKLTDATYTTVRQHLAQEWEEAILVVQNEQDQLERFDQQRLKTPTAQQQKQLMRLQDDVRKVWRHPKASMVLKKQIVRTLIDEIIVDREKPRHDIVLTIHWAGGRHTELRVPTRRKKRDGQSADLKTVVRVMRKLLTDESMASILNREKLKRDDGKNWTAQRVTAFRQEHKIPAFNADTKEKKGWLTQTEAATRLAISPMSISRLVRDGILPAEQPARGLPTVINAKDLSLPHVQHAVGRLKNSTNRPLTDDPRQLYLFETSEKANS